MGLHECTPPCIARSIEVLHQAFSSRSAAEGRRAVCPRRSFRWYSKPCSSRGMELSVCDAPMTDPMTTVEVTHKYRAENATEWTSTPAQLVGPGSDDAAFISAIIQPPINITSAKTTGRDLVARSAAKEYAVSSYRFRSSFWISACPFNLRLRFCQLIGIQCDMGNALVATKVFRTQWFTAFVVRYHDNS